MGAPRSPLPAGMRERDKVEGGQADAHVQARHVAPDGRDDLAEEPGAILEAPAVRPRARVRRQELVQQVAVAALDVDEVIARPRRRTWRPPRSPEPVLQFRRP